MFISLLLLSCVWDNPKTHIVYIHPVCHTEKNPYWIKKSNIEELEELEFNWAKDGYYSKGCELKLKNENELKQVFDSCESIARQL